MDIQDQIPIFDYLTHQIEGKTELLHLAGPMVANEFARGSKTLGVMSRPYKISREVINQLFQNTPLEFEFSTDIQGLVWGSILKNIYVIGWGIIEVLASDNMNLKGIYISKAFAEMVNITKQEGGFKETIYGLSGLGDFMATSLSIHSHNRIYGMHIASMHKNGILHDGKVSLPEGHFSLKALTNRYQNNCHCYPLLNCINNIVFNAIPAHTLIDIIPNS